MPEGAVDHDYDENERSYEQRVREALEQIRQKPTPGGVAIDVVTRQAVFVRQISYPNCREHYEAEGYDLVTYKMHPYLPGISPENTVYECVYLDGNPQNAHKVGDTYDFPEARLMHYPVEQAWKDMVVGDV